MESIDLQRHKGLFFKPQAITTMSLSTDKSLLLVGRENNSIEIWKISTWIQLLVIPGNKLIDVKQLYWLEPKSKTKVGECINPLYYERIESIFKKRRVISVGLNGLITEWDLFTLKPKAKYSQSQAIYDSKLIGKSLLLACEDGSIKIADIKKTGINFVKTLPKADSMCLSLAVQPSQDLSHCKAVFAGYKNSAIRKWDLISGNSTQQFQKASQKKKNKAKIWKLLLIKGFLVSGDSHGEVCIWDEEFGTLIKTFNNLKGDVLALEFNPKFNVLYATGVDSRVLQLSLIQSENSSDWVFSHLFRGQSHDISSLKMINQNELISGGITSDICIYSLTQGICSDQYGKNSKQHIKSKKLRHIPPFPFKQQAQVTDSSLVQVNGDNQSLDIYDLSTSDKIFRLEKKGQFGINCMDSFGNFIVYSDCKDTQVFSIDSINVSLKKHTQKICHYNQIQTLPAALFVKITGGNQVILVTQTFKVATINLESLEYKEIMDVKKCVEKYKVGFKLRRYDQIMSLCQLDELTNTLLIQFMRKDLFLALDLKNICVKGIIPSLSSEIPLCINCDEEKVVIGYDSNRILVVEKEGFKVHPWSKQNVEFPGNFARRFNRFMGIVQISLQKFIIYTNYTYIVLDLNEDVPKDQVQILQDHPNQNPSLTPEDKNWFDRLKLSQQKYLNSQVQIPQEEELKQESQSKNLMISNKLKGILKMHYFPEKKSLIVLENEWKKVLKEMPGTLAIKKFGH